MHQCLQRVTKLGRENYVSALFVGWKLIAELSIGNIGNAQGRGERGREGGG